MKGRISGQTFAATFLAYAVLAIAVCGLAVFPPTKFMDRNPIRGLGIGLMCAGLTVYVVARLEFRTFRRTWGLDASRLVVDGIYARCRHPQVLGWSLLLVGISIAAASAASLFFALLFVAASAVWLPIEEAALEARFGDAFARYRSVTPLLVPRLRAKRGSWQRRGCPLGRQL